MTTAGSRDTSPLPDRHPGDPARPAQDARRAVAAVDLASVVSGVLASPQWATEPRSSCALVHTPELRVVLTALHAGATMHNDDPDEAMTVHGIRGRVAVSVNAETADLDEGSLLCMPSGVAWELTATTDAVVLLTVVRPGPDRPISRRG